MDKPEYHFRKGEILLVDKPLNWTSFDVVNKLRWKLKKKYNIKRFKVGHAGTLDPLATGLLIVCTGKSTKLSSHLTAEDKVYEGNFLLGKTTPSYDLETDFDNEFNIDHITPVKIEKLAQQFIGKQQQIPPLFSAKKINGKRAYEMARENKKVQLKSNPITIHSFDVNCSGFPSIRFKISCSKGTYIRSIAHDFGKELGAGATLTQLHRTHSGQFSISNAKTIDQWLEIIDTTNPELI